MVFLLRRSPSSNQLKSALADMGIDEPGYILVDCSMSSPMRRKARELALIGNQSSLKRWVNQDLHVVEAWKGGPYRLPWQKLLSYKLLGIPILAV
jgi:hypothetical protein